MHGEGARCAAVALTEEGEGAHRDHLDPARLRSGERLLTLHPDRARRHLPASVCMPWAVAVVARRQ